MGMRSYSERTAPKAAANAILAVATEASAFSVDFLEMRGLVRDRTTPANDNFGDPNNKLTYNSPSTKWVRNASGIYVSGTTLRTDYLANGTALGLLVEGQRTNEVANNSMQGAAAGSSGTIPTGWNISGGSGLTRTLTITTVDGVECLGWRFVGTTADTALAISWTTAALIVAATADVWTNSAFMALTDGAMTNINTFRLAISERTSGGSLVTTQHGSDIKSSLTSTLARFVQTSTLAGGGTVARIQPRIEIAYSNGVAVDFTVLIGWPQCEKAASASSPIRTTSAAVTRAADNISILLSALPFDATKGTLLAKGIPATIASGLYTLAQLRQDSSNNIQIYNSGANRCGQVTSGGTQVATLTGAGSAVAGTASKRGFSWKQDDFALSVDGGTIQTDTGGALPSAPTTFYIGSANGASSHFEGWLQQLIYLPRDMSDAELVAWSTL